MNQEVTMNKINIFVAEKKYIFIFVLLILLVVIIFSLFFFKKDKVDKNKAREDVAGEIYPISINDAIDIYLSPFQGTTVSPFEFNHLRIINYQSGKTLDILNSDSKMSFLPLDIEKLEKEKMFKEVDLTKPLLYKDDLFFYDWGEEIDLDVLLFEKGEDNLFIVFEYIESKNENEEDIIVPKKGYVFSLFYNDKKEVSLKKVYETKNDFYHAYIDNGNLILLEKETVEDDRTTVPSFLRPYVIKRYVFENGKFELTNEEKVNPFEVQKKKDKK